MMNLIRELPSFVLIVLITTFVIWSTNKEGFFSKVYQWVPPILLLYLLPALANNVGLVKSGDVLRVLAMNAILPLSLIILTAIIHIPDLLRVTRKGLWIFFAGTLGIIIGGPLALKIAGLFNPQLLQQEGRNATWRGLICITGSWINGTPGQISMREVYGSSEELFLTSLATDIILQNIWLFFLLYSVKFYKRINRWLTKNEPVEYDRIDRETGSNEHAGNTFTFPPVKLWIVLAITYMAVLLLSDLCSAFFTQSVGSDDTNPWSFLANKSLWLILLSTSSGIALSFTNIFKEKIRFWTVLGKGMLFFIMATIGLQLNLRQVQINPTFFIIGLIWLLIHLIILLISAKLSKAPWHFIAIGSEANIGGPASASIVASSFHPSLASLGILLGVLSNLIGNYANLIGGFLFQLVTS
ncbi:MAG: DUF819 family protein [Chitinophagaceae bacterium]